IFFEGTYSHTFSGSPEPTPRYDYNQVMYRLDLADPRLALPVPVYEPTEGPQRFRTRDRLRERGDRRVAFFALDRAVRGTVPVHEADGGLRVGGPRPGDGPSGPLFHALPAGAKGTPATTTPLYELTSEDGKRK